MTQPQRDILSQSPEALAAWCREQDVPVYRRQQLLQWLYRDFAADWNAMNNLPRDLRDRLSAAFAFPRLDEATRRTAADGETAKALFVLGDGERIESVWMRDEGRVTCCISSQAGCALGCAFCATGAGGFRRNLTTGEILGQVTALARALGAPRNVVFMGMGEPLLNVDALLPALAALTDPRRFGLGARRVTVSTAGVTPGIERLAEGPVFPNLALSLTSPFDAQRSRLMPVNRRFPLTEVLAACERYSARSGRRLLLEYVLLGGENASLDDAEELAHIARHARALVNLIACNPVAGCAFASPPTVEVQRFRARLEEKGVAVTQRYRRGREIAAGCGQLRAERRPAGDERET